MSIQCDTGFPPARQKGCWREIEQRCTSPHLRFNSWRHPYWCVTSKRLLTWDQGKPRTASWVLKWKDWIHLSIFISFPSTHFYPDQTVTVDWALKMKESVNWIHFSLFRFVFFSALSPWHYRHGRPKRSMRIFGVTPSSSYKTTLKHLKTANKMTIIKHKQFTIT